MTSPAKLSTSAIVDKLGSIRRQIADLEATERLLKNQIAVCGPGVWEGDLFDAQVIESMSHRLDTAAARVKLIELGCSDQWLVAHTKSTPVVTVRTKLRSAAISKLVADAA